MKTVADFRLEVRQLENGSYSAVVHHRGTAVDNDGAGLQLLRQHNVDNNGNDDVDNATTLVDVIIHSLTNQYRRHQSRGSVDNPSGAVYYVLAVVFIYGLSIILMIGSQIRKNKHDKGVAKSV